MPKVAKLRRSLLRTPISWRLQRQEGLQGQRIYPHPASVRAAQLHSFQPLKSSQVPISNTGFHIGQTLLRTTITHQHQLHCCQVQNREPSITVVSSVALLIWRALCSTMSPWIVPRAPCCPGEPSRMLTSSSSITTLTVPSDSDSQHPGTNAVSLLDALDKLAFSAGMLYNLDLVGALLSMR